MSRVSTTMWLALPAALALALAMSSVAAAQDAPGAADLERTTAVTPLQFHYMGPSPGGRISAAVGIPGNHSTYYLGAASGGLWKSTDGGHTYIPIFDDQNVAAIGSLAIAATDSNTV
ncbi:MAG TPA: hypothetical protein VN614_10535, partial [Rhodanobacter sp.]|nr:hypothetical protein [Rhodanobacter sp.]